MWPKGKSLEVTFESKLVENLIETREKCIRAKRMFGFVMFILKCWGFAC